MPCSHVQTLLPEYVLHLLDADEQQQVEQHLATGCLACQDVLDEFREAAAMIPDTTTNATPLAPPMEVKQELMRRVHQTPAVTLPQQTFSRRRWLFAAYATAAAVAFVAGTLWNQSPPASTLTHAEREALYQERMAAIQRSFDASTIRLATAARNSTSTEKQGAVVWDPQAHEVHLYAFGLTPPHEGVLQTWLVDDQDRYTPAGTLEVSDRGDSAQVFAVPLAIADLSSIVVTREAGEVTEPLPAGQTPTGEMVLVAPFGAAP